eukprot:2168243-Pyramimonas_sp.AAC.1
MVDQMVTDCERKSAPFCGGLAETSRKHDFQADGGKGFSANASRQKTSGSKIRSELAVKPQSLFFGDAP